MALAIPVMEIVKRNPTGLLSIKDSWKRIQVKDIAKVINGFAFKSSMFNNAEGMPIIRIRDIHKNMTEKLYKGKYDETYVVKKGDILIGMDGDFRLSDWKGPDALLNQRVCKVVVDETKYNKKFFTYVMPGYLDAIHKKTSSVTVKHLSSYTILNTPLPNPPLNEQNIIVNEIETQLTRLDASIKGLMSAKTKLNVYRKSVLNEAFSGKLTKDNEYNFNPQDMENQLEEFNRNKSGKNKPSRLPSISYKDLPKLPQHWFWVMAHKVCSSVRDGTHDTPKYVKDGYPLVTSKNLQNGNLTLKNIKFISKEDYDEINKRSNVEVDDILFAMIGTIGNPVVIKTKPNYAIKNVGLFKISNSVLNPNYLKYWLDSNKYYKIIKEKKLIRGTTQLFISLGGLRVSPVPYCSIEEQNEIVNEIESRFSVIDKLQQIVDKSLLKSRKLRKSILKSAFEGKLVKIDG